MENTPHNQEEDASLRRRDHRHNEEIDFLDPTFVKEAMCLLERIKDQFFMEDFTFPDIDDAFNNQVPHMELIIAQSFSFQERDFVNRGVVMAKFKIAHPQYLVREGYLDYDRHGMYCVNTEKCLTHDISSDISSIVDGVYENRHRPWHSDRY